MKSKLELVELRRIALPLVSPFRTSFGIERERDILLVRVEKDGQQGWGECVAASGPFYSSEYVDGAEDVMRRFLVPALFDAGEVSAADVAPALGRVVGHRMAKGALEMAVLDAELGAQGVSLAEHLGAVRDAVACGVSVGIFDDTEQLLEAVAGYIDEGYRRIKLKIEPGSDIAPVRAVRERFGDELPLQVDANTAYSLTDASHLARLDEFGLLLIEQPFPPEQLRAHAALAGQVQTPICLDESITSAGVADEAIEMGACSIVNIKAGRVGGILEARRIHDVCAGRGVPVWCGGMLETGIGRAANVALAALENFTLPGDTSASRRYYETDITPPFELEDGTLRVPRGPGLGVAPVPEILNELTTKVETFVA